MKKITLFLFVAFLPLVIISCSKDDDTLDDADKQIIGTWKFVKTDVALYNKGVQVPIPEGMDLSGVTEDFTGQDITFTTDGTYHYGGDTGKYTLNGNDLMIYFSEDSDDYDTQFKIESINSSSMVLSLEKPMEDLADLDDDQDVDLGPYKDFSVKIRLSLTK